MGAQLTVNFTLSGYITSLTLDGENGVELLGKVGAVVKKLGEMGATPTATTNGSNSGGSKSNGVEICPIHGAKMQRREKNGETWYSHKAYREDGSEYWCRGVAKS